MSDRVDSLRRALKAAAHPLAGCALQALPDKGLAHDHVRLAGSGWLARIPKQSQMGLAADQNLAYQRACFERAAVGGHTPVLLGVLAPSMDLSRGALLVAEIQGRPASLPRDLTAIVRALASMHRLPLPPEAQRAPLLNHSDPLGALVAEITAQATHLPLAGVDPAVSMVIEEELGRLRRLCAQPPRPQRHLIAFDGHPGNFIVRPDGSAVLVDLEKCRYSYPGLDLAHATLYTSTTWDLESHAVLSEGDVAAAYATWHRRMGGAAGDAARWHIPLRKAMWLWSMTWCVKWRVLSRAQTRASGDGEDWSAGHSEAGLVAHVRERVDHYLGLTVVMQVLHGFDALEKVMSS